MFTPAGKWGGLFPALGRLIVYGLDLYICIFPLSRIYLLDCTVAFRRKKSPREELFSPRDSSIMLFREGSIQTLSTCTSSFIKKLTQYRQSWKAQPDFLLIHLLAPRRQLFPMEKKNKTREIQVEPARKTQNIWKHWENVWPPLFKVSVCMVMPTARLAWPGGTQQILLGVFAWPRVPADRQTETHSAHMRKFFPYELKVTCTRSELPVPLDLHALQSTTLNYQAALSRMTQKLAEPFVLTPQTLPKTPE